MASAPPTSARPVRLEFADDLFARRHRGLGSPVVNQWVWRLEEPYDAERLRSLADGLARGGLSRRLHRALVPGARDVWTNAGEPPAIELSASVLPAQELLPWLRAHHLEPIDPHVGRTWRLAATDLDDGGAVVSLILAHAVGDGGSVIDSVSRAATGAPPLLLPPRAGSLVGRVVEDVHDAAGQVATIARWVRARAEARRAGSAAPATKRAPSPMVAPSADEGWECPRLILELDTAELADVAARHGGSTNAWFVAVMARLLEAIGHVPADDGPVPVSLPMSDFQPGDTRSNSTRVTRVEVARETLRTRDLAAVKALCKDAYARLTSAGTGFVPVPLALIQMLPDPVIKRLPAPPSAACMASNLGTLPHDYLHAGGERVRSVAAMASYQQASADEVRALGGGLIAWLVGGGPRTTFQVIAAEPDRVPDQDALRRLVHDELAGWGLAAEEW